MLINVDVVLAYDTCGLEHGADVRAAVINLLLLLCLYAETRDLILPSGERVTVALERVPDLAIVCLLISTQYEN